MSDEAIHIVNQFTTNVEMLLQQMDSRLLPAVNQMTCVGQTVTAVEQYGTTSLQEVTSLYAPRVAGTTTKDRRWLVQPNPQETVEYFSEYQQIQMLIDPRASYAQAAAAAQKRFQDETILTAMFADAPTGVTATTTTTSFPAAQQVAVTVGGGGSNVGLNMHKLRSAKKLHLANENTAEPLYICLNAKLIEDLQAFQDVTDQQNKLSATFDADGNLKSVLGFRVIHTELLDTDGSGYLRVPVFSKSAIMAGVWMPLKSEMEKATWLQGSPWQVVTAQCIGAVRTQEKKIVEIKCTAS